MLYNETVRRWVLKYHCPEAFQTLARFTQVHGNLHLLIISVKLLTGKQLFNDVTSCCELWVHPCRGIFLAAVVNLLNSCLTIYQNKQQNIIWIQVQLRGLIHREVTAKFCIFSSSTKQAKKIEVWIKSQVFINFIQHLVCLTCTDRHIF